MDMFFDPQIRMLHCMDNLVPSMRKDPGEDLKAWQAKARPELARLLGLPMAQVAADGFRVLEEKEFPDYTDTTFTFFSEPEVEVLCRLLLPRGTEKPPVVICLQGHATGMHISFAEPKYPGDESEIYDGDRDFARQVIARGQAALGIEQRAFGERGGTPEGPACYQPAVQALLLGKTLIGQRVWDISRALDCLEAHFPAVDTGRTAIMGNSGGGTATIYAAAMDERIGAAMPSCAFCGFEASIGAQTHCICNYIPGIMEKFDMADLAGLIAPRPLVIVNGKDDDIFPLFSAKEQVEVLKKCYYTGESAPLAHVIGQAGHRFYAAQAWPEFDRLTGWKKQG